nr:sugar transferase [Bifidobacterium longum]
MFRWTGSSTCRTTTWSGTGTSGSRPSTARASWTGGASSASWHNQKAGTRKSNKTVPPPNLKILLNINSNDLSEEESQQLDVSYVQNWSVLGDIVYILRTIGTVLHPNGAY